MNKCLTIVAQQPVTKNEINDLLSSMLDIISIESHVEKTNVYFIYCSEQTQLFPKLREALYAVKWDFALQSAKPAEKKLFLSDMDSTIVMTETIDEMAAVYGVGQQVSEITAAAMRGELDYQASLSARLALLKGMPKQALLDMASATEITPTAKELLDEINRRDIFSCLISGGFTLFTGWVAEQLGFDHQVANVLSFDERACLDGRWVGELVTSEVKLATLKRLASEHHLSLAQTIAIGDGANDIDMVKAAGLGVAFYGKPALRAVAQAEIHSGSIDNLIHFL